MIIVEGGTEIKYYYLRDALGSVVALLNNRGDVKEAYSYEVFGSPYVHTVAGSNNKWLSYDDTIAATPVSAYGNCWMFTARQWDSESGLYYYRARMYHPTIDRFLQPDPIGYYDSMNLYQYCLNNPVNWIDPWGLATVRITTTNGQKLTLIDPSLDEFKKTIASLENGSIRDLSITGHGRPSYMSIEAGEGEGLMIGADGKVHYTTGRTDVSFADSTSEKFSENATIELNGCNTARGWPWNNIARQLSRDLPNTTVTGNAGFAPSTGVSLWFLGHPDIGFRVTKEEHAIGIPKRYMNGKRIW